MQYFIREWPDQKASLVAEDGYTLAVFDNLREAKYRCAKDCMTVPEYVERHCNYLASTPDDFESSFINSNQ